MIRDTPSSGGSSLSILPGLGGGGDYDFQGQSSYFQRYAAYREHAPYLMMDAFLDKLKMMNYDDHFMRHLKIRPLHRHYFAIQTNPGEQFFMFTSLAAWLFSKAGLSMEAPQESDDPNSLIATILDLTRQLNIPVDFPPNKLKPGFGPYVIYILDAVADMAVKMAKITFKKPQYPKEEATEEVIVEDDSELLLEKIEEEMVAEMSSDEEDDALMNLEDLHRMNNISFQDSQSTPDPVMESNVDEEEWRLEVERVLPLLRITLKPDSRDWRAHLDQMSAHKQKIEETMRGARAQLDKLSAHMGAGLEKIATREKMLNAQLGAQLAKFRAVQDELRHVTERYRELSVGVGERQRQLNKISEELVRVKQEMEQRGSSMTDGSPLINIKKAITVLKSELKSINIQIGVADHTLLQARLRDKTSVQNSANHSVAALH